jgi:hypothetical protein
MARYELPSGLTPEEERAVREALQRALEGVRPPMSPWALAGRAEATRRGALQVRREAGSPWPLRAPIPLAARGTPPLRGRGDAR